MKQIQFYSAEKYHTSDYQQISDCVFKHDNFYVTSLSFMQEPIFDEGSNASDISQYPLEDILDKYGVFISDFYPQLNTEDSVRCVLEFCGKSLESITRLLSIYKGKTACHVHNHEIVAATAILFDTNDSEIEMDVEYCPKCDKYLLNYISFEHYREKYGVLIGKLRMVLSTGTFGEFELAAESPLKLCGYNVSETEGLSTSTRQFILSKMIHDGIMKKTDVIHYLEHFINMNGAKKENFLAAQKWRDDLDFVHRYNMDIQPKTFIINVKKY